MLKNIKKFSFFQAFSIALFLFAISTPETSCNNAQVNLKASEKNDSKENYVLEKIKIIEEQISQTKEFIKDQSEVKKINQIQKEIGNLKLDCEKQQSSTAMFILGPLETVYSVAKDRDFKYKLLQVSNKLTAVLEFKDGIIKKEVSSNLNKSIKRNGELIIKLTKK